MIAVGTSNCHAIVPGGHDPAGEIVALLRILTGHGEPIGTTGRASL